MVAAQIFLTGFVLLSAFDIFYFHLWKERLTSSAKHLHETRLHAWGNGITAALALCLAWLEWHGWTILLPLGLIAWESALGILDYLEEKRSRPVKFLEKAAHWCMLLLHTGFLFCAAPSAWDWWQKSSHTVVSPGTLSISLTLSALLLLGGAISESRVFRRFQKPKAAPEDV